MQAGCPRRFCRFAASMAPFRSALAIPPGSCRADQLPKDHFYLVCMNSDAFYPSFHATPSWGLVVPGPALRGRRCRGPDAFFTRFAERRFPEHRIRSTMRRVAEAQCQCSPRHHLRLLVERRKKRESAMFCLFFFFWAPFTTPRLEPRDIDIAPTTPQGFYRIHLFPDQRPFRGIAQTLLERSRRKHPQRMQRLAADHERRARRAVFSGSRPCRQVNLERKHSSFTRSSL